MTEATYRQRFDMLQAGLDLLDQGLTVFDADLRMVAWNDPFLKLLDFPPELAYGPAGGGHRLSGRTLIFVIDLLDVR